MATAIKAIPTLYGKEARRFRDMADEAERRYAMRPKRDITKDPIALTTLGYWSEIGEYYSRLVLLRQRTGSLAFNGKMPAPG